MRAEGDAQLLLVLAGERRGGVVLRPRDFGSRRSMVRPPVSDMISAASSPSPPFAPRREGVSGTEVARLGAGMSPRAKVPSAAVPDREAVGTRGASLVSMLFVAISCGVAAAAGMAANAAAASIGPSARSAIEMVKRPMQLQCAGRRKSYRDRRFSRMDGGDCAANRVAAFLIRPRRNARLVKLTSRTPAPISAPRSVASSKAAHARG
ncbi:hypothetical protein EDF56_104340 [Novosphingobium sp. PhB165]|nr:hypothetical protein EDF56_104340 [Novosphingobium sp. PhB165]